MRTCSTGAGLSIPVQNLSRAESQAGHASLPMYLPDGRALTPRLGEKPRMDTFVIDGGRRLEGRVRINGAKNAALPLMAAALLTSEKVTIRDIPPLADIRNMERLLAELGCQRLT